MREQSAISAALSYLIASLILVGVGIGLPFAFGMASSGHDGRTAEVVESSVQVTP